MITVCMATYNGEKYIEKQLNSILEQLDEDDEIIIYDDNSLDSTFDTIYSMRDKRIKLYRNNFNMGVNKTFENALKKAKGEIVFLSDQDDVWHRYKKQKIIEYFREHPDVDLIQHDALVIDEKDSIIADSFYDWRGFIGKGILRNLIRSSYLGCCMAMRKSVIKDVLPITALPYHDIWIGIIAQISGHKVSFINEKLISYVRHRGTTTDIELKHRPCMIILRSRIKYIIEILKYIYKRNICNG